MIWSEAESEADLKKKKKNCSQCKHFLFFSKLWKNHSCWKRRGKRARGEEVLKKVRFKQNKTKKKCQRWSQLAVTDAQEPTKNMQRKSIWLCTSGILHTHSLFYPNNYLCLSNTLSSLSPIIFPWKACHWCDGLRASWSLPTNDSVTGTLSQT